MGTNRVCCPSLPSKAGIEEFSFVAMRLLDGEMAESIQPVEITYPGTQPMIPLRLTAVAALGLWSSSPANVPTAD